MLNLPICDLLECQDIQNSVYLNKNLKKIKTKCLNAERLLKKGSNTVSEGTLSLPIQRGSDKML